MPCTTPADSAFSESGQLSAKAYFLIFAGMGKYACTFGPGIACMTLACCLLILTACQDDDVCGEHTSNPLRIGFFHLEDNQPAVVDSLTVYGTGGTGEYIYDNRRNVSRIELPLDPGNDACGFVLHFPGYSDTLYLSYEREVVFISVECGFTMYFEIGEAWSTSSFIRLVETHETLISDSRDEHLKIFIPAVSDGDQQ